MASHPEHDTLICLFHHTDRAERTVQELLEIGIPENDITLIGRARQTADIDTGTASLEQINVPEADRKHLRDGLRKGGSIVAVSAHPSMASQIEDIFREYSADKIDEKVVSIPDPPPLATTLGGIPFSSHREPTFAVIPAEDVLTLPEDGDPALDEILLVTEPETPITDTTEIITVEETLVLLEPTGAAHDTATANPAQTERFDPDAPLDNVRNPAADPLNDPRNRR